MRTTARAFFFAVRHSHKPLAVPPRARPHAVAAAPGRVERMAAAAHDLAELLDLPCCECFNADDDHPLRNALAAESRDDASLLLESDVDEGAQLRCATLGIVCVASTDAPNCAELLVILRFRQLVKVSQIALKAPSDKGPRSVKARATRPSPSGWVLGRSMRYATVAFTLKRG